MTKKITIIWKNSTPKGKIEIAHGKSDKSSFSFKTFGENRLEISLKNICLDSGAKSTVITILEEKNPFTFFLRDVDKKNPIYIPEFAVIVTQGNDQRSFSQIKNTIHKKKGLSRIEKYEKEPEDTFEKAFKKNRDMPSPTWLGISRDVRIFEVEFPDTNFTAKFSPRFHGYFNELKETDNKAVCYYFSIGRGSGPNDKIKRRLEDGYLPILNTTVTDEEVIYEITSFVSLEKNKLSQENINGTHFLVADSYGRGFNHTLKQQEECAGLKKTEINHSEETVLFCRVKVKNTAFSPRHAFFKTIIPKIQNEWANMEYSYNCTNGFSQFATGGIFAVSKLNGKPLPQEELTILLKPMEETVFEISIPHSPINEVRANKLFKKDFEKLLFEAKTFWKEKMKIGLDITLPDKRVEEMVKAGIIHFDLVLFGREPNGPVTPIVGVYSSIGSESAPIIQFLTGAGRYDLAKRAIMFFIKKQYPNGFMQNFGNYMLETGAVLWTIGEYYRHTKDEKFIREIKDNILKACEFQSKWRTRNKKPELKGKGFGMIEGKCADPKDPFRAYMLNGFAYIGFKRSAEVLKNIDPVNSSKLEKEAEDFKKDILTALKNNVARSPVVPLGNGRWVPTVSPWAEDNGLCLQYLNPKNCYSHGSFTVRDAIIGPLYLLIQEVLPVESIIADWIINYSVEVLNTNNVTFSQPYYSRHPWVHLKRGEKRAFLKTYYNTVSALADRETYNFWEHFFKASPHKTHEEAWFLMDTRWMLWMEEGNTLKLLSGTPDKWFKDGSVINIKNASSYFGEFSLNVKVKKNRAFINIKFASAKRAPDKITIRIKNKIFTLEQKKSIIQTSLLF